jgi:hypothetical protein
MKMCTYRMGFFIRRCQGEAAKLKVQLVHFNALILPRCDLPHFSPALRTYPTLRLPYTLRFLPSLRSLSTREYAVQGKRTGISKPSTTNLDEGACVVLV